VSARRFGFGLLVLLFAVLGSIAEPDRVAAAEPPPRGWEQAMAAAAPVLVTTERVPITHGELSGLALRGAWVLSGDHRDFGGFSGLAISNGNLVAVTDFGWWFGASLDDDGGSLRLTNARLAPMRDHSGARYSKAGGDAEGLTRQGDDMVVSFERDHRLMVLHDSGRLGSPIQSRTFEQLRTNKALEALATLPDNRLIVIAEGPDDQGFPIFVVDLSGEITEARLPRVGFHLVTGADVGPDGFLYLVLREYSPIFGVSIRVMRYHLGPNGLPIYDSAETLAAFEADSGIDNMEGIALDRGLEGDVTLWLISDDNFRLSQRTLLVQFDVLP
jgi:hypothetical protein